MEDTRKKGEFFQDLILGMAVIIAMFAGPVLAVLVRRHIDNVRQAWFQEVKRFS
jgi:hypothetical protein